MSLEPRRCTIGASPLHYVPDAGQVPDTGVAVQGDTVYQFGQRAGKLVRITYVTGGYPAVVYDEEPSQ